MSTRANYFKIGVFVITGTVLAVVATIVFGAGAFLKDYATLETYFDESVQGLSEGSPVKYRGVQIGFVEEINYCRNKYPLDETDPKFNAHSRYVYVRVALYPRILEGLETPEEVRTTLASLVRRGLRARLASLGVTGQAYLEVDYLDVALNPPLDISWEPRHYYVPSAPSTLIRISEAASAILRDLKAVPFHKIGDNLDTLLVTVEGVASKIDFREAKEEITAVIREFRGITERVRELLDDPQVDSIPGDSAAIVRRVRELVDRLEPETRTFVESFDRATSSISNAADRITALVEREEIEATVKELPEALALLNRAVRRFNSIVATQQQDIETILENVRVVSDDLREISANAKRYPSQLLFGEPPTRKEND